MKTLTFKEVLETIKPNEKYISCNGLLLLKEIKCTKDGDFDFKLRDSRSLFSVPKYAEFKKEEIEYAFDEAYDALLKGKIIKSIFSNMIYCYKGKDILKKITINNGSAWLSLGGMIFKSEEIFGKWHILEKEED